MGDDVQAIHRFHACLAAIRQTQTTANRLLDQRPRIGGAQRHDGVQISHVPAFLEHVHVNHDLGRLVIAFHRQQLLDDFITLGTTGGTTVHLNHFARIPTAEEFSGLNQRHQLAGMGGVAGNHQHEGLDHFLAALLRIGQKMHLGFFMDTHAVHQLDAFKLLRAMRVGIKVLLGHYGRFFDETVFNGACQRIIQHHILEGHRPLAAFGEWGCRQLQPQQRPQFIQCPNTRAGAITMRFIHDQHQVVQRGQILVVALTQIFRQPLDARCPAATHCTVDLGDIEDVDLNAPEQTARTALLVVVAGNHLRRIHRELGNALEHILGAIRCEVANQLVVNGQVRCQHKEMLVAISHVQVADKGAHQARLAHTRGQGKTQ